MLAVFFAKVAPKLVQFFIIFGSNFGSLFWGLGVLWVSFGSLLGPLDSLLGGPKSEKMPTVPHENHFFENAVFGSLKLLMVLLGSSWPLLGRSGLRMGSKMGSKSSPKRDQQNVER